jgi:hypothetical protein
MSRLLTVDVWNCRFPNDGNVAWDAPTEQKENPSKGDFMGQARMTFTEENLGNVPSLLGSGLRFHILGHNGRRLAGK